MLAAPLLAGSACENKKPADTGAISAMDRASSGSAATVNDTTPLAGIDTSKLEGDRPAVFFKLVASLSSPCGKAHSLRTSFSSDASCKRAPFAVKYLLALLEDEQPEAEVREMYAARYEKPAPALGIDVSKAPRVGNDDAPVRLVEFFDYECPHCATFAPVLHAVSESHKGKLVEYFMMFPIESKHPESRSAAQAAIAASAQGKFPEMHKLLFEKSPMHGKDAVLGYATALGLDLTKFAADYAAASAQVTSDASQGDKAGVDSTPSLFINDRRYEGPAHPKYIGMWIDEEVAVNR